MQWGSAGIDSFYSKGQNVQQKFPSVDAAVNYCTGMGWGYDVTYPHYKWHSKKDYSENFKYKGPAKPEADYD